MVDSEIHKERTSVILRRFCLIGYSSKIFDSDSDHERLPTSVLRQNQGQAHSISVWPGLQSFLIPYTSPLNIDHFTGIETILVELD